MFTNRSRHTSKQADVSALQRDGNSTMARAREKLQRSRERRRRQPKSRAFFDIA
jgi:hypothetical protein